MQQMMAMTPQQRTEMGRAGRNHVQSQYDIEGVLDRWENIYEELLAAKLPAA
jgi:glycosyltransferase involved in cell wall biosynthesis